MKAVIDRVEAPGHLGILIARLQSVWMRPPAGPGDPLDNAVTENVGQTVAHLRTLGPVLADLVGAGKASIVGAHYDLETGLVTVIE